MSSEIAFYSNFHIKSACIDTWLNAAKKMIEISAKEETFIDAYLHRDVNDPTRFTLYERWSESSIETFIENQLKKKSYRDQYEKQMAEWCQTPRTFSQLEPIKDWHK